MCYFDVEVNWLVVRFVLILLLDICEEKVSGVIGMICI